MAAATRCVYVTAPAAAGMEWRAEWEGHPDAAVRAPTRAEALALLEDSGQCAAARPEVVADVGLVPGRDGKEIVGIRRITFVADGVTFAAWPESVLWVAYGDRDEAITARYEAGKPLTLDASRKRVLLRSLSYARAEQFRTFLAAAFPAGV